MMKESRRVVWFILARMIVVSLFLVSTIILRMKGTGPLGVHALEGITKIVVATYGFSIVSLLFLRVTARYDQTVTYFQIIWDILFVTLLILFTGGVTSPFSFLYLLAITSASVLLARREALYTASLCAIIYGAIMDLQYFGRLVDLGLSPVPAQKLGTTYIFYTIFLNIIAFCSTALLTGYLAERARRSETELEQKAIDYDELERLNSTIVSNLNSGLITVTGDGRIRVFNRYAEALTGIGLAEAYDCHLFDVLPGFRVYADVLANVKRGEFEFIAKMGRKLTIGFSSVPLMLKDSDAAGILLNFQDVTQVRRMEESLKKSDRLAAIGELSARIAHEIRNPLAAISGSTQLIAQGGAVSDPDRRLFDIVLRETDRLNGLISDFLAYARPNQPEPRTVDFHSLVAELAALVTSDEQFEGVVIDNRVDSNFRPLLDQDQFRQVLWNLMGNAAGAMPDGGTITVKAGQSDEIRGGGQRRITYRISVADTGLGMDEATVARIFEPFFTTKSTGTGLGLATVHRIVEAHGGRIAVESTPGKGTMFVIFLPTPPSSGESAISQ